MNTLYTLMDTLRSIIHTSETAITDIRKQHFWKTAFHIKELIFYFTQLFNNCSTLLNQQSISLLNSYLGKMLDAQNILAHIEERPRRRAGQPAVLGLPEIPGILARDHL